MNTYTLTTWLAFLVAASGNRQRCSLARPVTTMPLVLPWLRSPRIRSAGRAWQGTSGLGFWPGRMAGGPVLGVPGWAVTGAVNRDAISTLRVPLPATTMASACPVRPVATRAVPATAPDPPEMLASAFQFFPSARVAATRLPLFVHTANAFPALSSASQKGGVLTV